MFAERIREMNLQRSVSEVSNDEALNGASQSDSLRLASRERETNSNTVPLSVYLQRAAKFRANLKKKKTEETKESECPIEKARAESATGANAPLNWLTPDQFGGEAEQPPAAHTGDDGMAPELQKLDMGDGQVSYSAPTVNRESSSLMQNEWLFSPVG